MSKSTLVKFLLKHRIYVDSFALGGAFSGVLTIIAVSVLCLSVGDYIRLGICLSALAILVIALCPLMKKQYGQK